MIGLDTNVLARYYIQDAEDVEAGRQHDFAKQLMESGQALFVCKTVILEFEWVMRGYYEFKQNDIREVFQHLLSQDHISIEDKPCLLQALTTFNNGFDFADALHHASYKNCSEMVSFDDKKFARRAKKAGLLPPVTVPS